MRADRAGPVDTDNFTIGTVFLNADGALMQVKRRASD